LNQILPLSSASVSLRGQGRSQWESVCFVSGTKGWYSELYTRMSLSIPFRRHIACQLRPRRTLNSTRTFCAYSPLFKLAGPTKPTPFSAAPLFSHPIERTRQLVNHLSTTVSASQKGESDSGEILPGSVIASFRLCHCLVEEPAHQH